MFILMRGEGRGVRPESRQAGMGGDYEDIGSVLTCHRVRVTVAGEKVLETRM